MRKAAAGGFDINGIVNGKVLTALTHEGPHDVYTNYVVEQLRRIPLDDLTSEQVASRVREIAGFMDELIDRGVNPLNYPRG